MMYLIYGIIGLAIGSFLNVVIYRMKELDTIINTRSHCPKCKKEIPWYDLIPFLSYIMLGTRCRYCKSPISWQYPVVEISTALLFMLTFHQFGFTLYSSILLLISCFLIVIFVYDLKNLIIPDEMIWPAIIIALIYWVSFSAFSHQLSALTNPLLGGIVGGGFIGLLVLITKGKGMGVGDIKLAFLIGLIVGFQAVILALFMAFAIGALWAVFLLIGKVKKLKDALPFAPFLIIGFYIALFWGEKIINWYLHIS